MACGLFLFLIPLAICAQTETTPSPCETPHFVPEKHFSMSSAVSSQDSRVLELDIQSSEGFGSVQKVELVPELGYVQELTIPNEPVPPSQPLVFLIPSDHLRRNSDLRVLLTVRDTAFGPSCVILQKIIVGTIPKTTIGNLTGP
jgi:hypothetical protein